MGGLGSKQSGPSVSVSPIMMNRKRPFSSGLTSPSTSTNTKPNLPKKGSAIKPPTSLPNRPFELTRTETNQSATHDRLSLDNYKHAESKLVSASNLGRSMAPASPVDKHGKALLNHTRVPSGTT